MHAPRPRRRLALAAGLAAGLALAALPTAQAGLLDEPAGTVEEAFAPQLVTVTADLAQRNLLAGSGLDVTEHAGHDYVEVVLHTPADLVLLESFDLPFQVRIPDLVQREAEIRAANEAYAASDEPSRLPSGRKSYRTLEDYESEMQQLATDHDNIVKLLELPHASIEGRTVYGLEIATGVNDTEVADDERPTFLLMGLHHAREWPSGEHTMEFAYDLIEGYVADDARIKQLVEGARTVLIPVVNPDGFKRSVDDGMLVDLNVINEHDPLDGLTAIVATPNNAYKRKNCRPFDGVDGIPIFCDLAKSPAGFGVGVDLNRNYGAFHGGPGSSSVHAHAIYHGGQGFSEPETQNVRELVSERHVTMLISNHTFSNLVLRPNGVDPQTIGPDGLPIGDAPDEEAMEALGAQMTAQNGYANIHGWELYDTTGTTEDWSYNATGGFGYTFEIGPDEFHPPFPEVVDEYVGAGEHEGKGNREAYLIALEAALDPANHSVVAGEATPGATLRLSRRGATPTWEGSFTDTVETVLTVPGSGRFQWHTNPSTRPLAMGKRYKVLDQTPRQEEVESGTVPAVRESVDVPWSTSTSADLVKVDLDWELPDDLDLEVYRVEGGKETRVTSSGNFPGQKESVTLVDVEAGAAYLFRVVNYAAVPDQDFELRFAHYDAETVETTGLIEAWTLTCEIDGRVVEQVPVVVDRGQQVLVDLEVCGPQGPPAPQEPVKGLALR